MRKKAPSTAAPKLTIVHVSPAIGRAARNTFGPKAAWAHRSHSGVGGWQWNAPLPIAVYMWTAQRRAKLRALPSQTFVSMPGWDSPAAVRALAAPRARPTVVTPARAALESVVLLLATDRPPALLAASFLHKDPVQLLEHIFEHLPATNGGALASEFGRLIARHLALTFGEAPL